LNNDIENNECKKIIVIYGTLAQRLANNQSNLSIKSVKKWVHKVIDLSAIKLNSTTHLDYRNYDATFSTNVGDEAISEATRQLVLRHHQDTQFININWENLNNLENTSNKPNLIVISGSGYFHFSKSGKLAERVKSDITYLKKLGIPYVLLGVGVNQGLKTGTSQKEFSIEPDDKKLIEDFLKNSLATSVRDENSKFLLQPFLTNEICLSGDPALLLHPTKSEKQKNKILKIGINFSFHGPLSTKILKNNLSKYISSLKKLNEIYRCEFYYFVHYETEKIIPSLLKFSGINPTVIEGSANYLADEYEKLDLHIGGMLHSCILATGSGTPCIGLAYDVKHFGFFEIMGIPENCINALDFKTETLIKKANDTLKNSISIRKTITNHKAELGIRTNDFLKTVLDKI